MVFSFNPLKVTKELILNHVTEEQIMSHYLGIIPDKDLHVNPLRADKHPTASFYRSEKNGLIFRDFATRDHLDFVNVVMKKFGVQYHRALNIIANDFNIVNKNNYAKNEAAIEYDGSKVDFKPHTIIQTEIQPFTTNQLEWWMKFGITQNTLNYYKVYSVKNVFLNGNFLYNSSKNYPIYGYFFGIEDSIELWKLYFPLRKDYRFLLNTNKLQGARQLPKTGEIVVVTKSMKDVMTLYELGIPAIAPQAESVLLSEKQYEALAKRFKYVIFNGDWDKAGIRFMAESRRKYKSICLSFKDKNKYGKDISDFVAMHGIEKAKLLIKKLRERLESGIVYNYQLRYCQSA